MKIRVLGWKYENIRRMGNLTVDLTRENDGVYANSLIMMPNGTGKTTTLYLIRAILSGSAMEWKEREVRSYRPAMDDVDEGRFILKMAFNDDIYYYILHLNYEEGTVWYETSSAMMAGGYEEGRRIPLPLRGILDNKEFVNRFIFDGEQARKALNNGSQEAENALIYLYQLNKLDDLIKKIDDLVRANQEQSSGGATERSVKVYQGKAEKRRKIYEDLEFERRDIDKQLKNMAEKQREYEQKYQEIVAQDHRMQQEQERLTKEQEQNKSEISETVTGLMDCIRKPYNLQLDIHTRLKGLVDNMRALKLPKTTAKEFFRELANGDMCICGRCITDRERKIIRARAEEYLGQDSLIVVNAVKGTLNEYERDDTCERLEKRLRAAMKKEDQIAGGLNRLTLALAKQGHEEILQIQKDMEELERRSQEYKKRAERLITTDYLTNAGLNQDNNIPKAKAAWKEAQDNYLRASGTYEFTRKAEKMKRYIEEIKANALEKLKRYMVQETNRKIETLITYDRIHIQKIDGHLILEGKDGASEGQTLAVAYAYIGTLFEHSNFRFPFIVDSPAAPMDLDVRREVARVLPVLFEQNVIFVTSGEKNGFADEFYKRDDVQYLTIGGKKDQPVVCTPGIAEFKRYQEAGEEE